MIKISGIEGIDSTLDHCLFITCYQGQMQKVCETEQVCVIVNTVMAILLA